MKKQKLFFFLGAIVIVGLSVGTYGIYMYFKTHDDLSKVRPDFVMTARAILSEFEMDEAAASVRYISKVIEITGPVESVEIGSDSTMNVILKDPGYTSGVICSFQGRNIGEMDVKKGSIATIRGECSGILFDVLLNNCVLIGN
ncbi:MAG TPA: hypothetical protein VI583_07780 [Cyclobacteriaceae bacterium]|nr:hypothetical protein [Cyclobacteriaceae bacterium]